VVARVAEARLPPRVRARARALLAGAPLAQVATWADDVREARPETARWHFVDIPLDAETYRPSRDCRRRRGGDCAIAAIARARAALADARAPQAQRAEALRFLVHLVADLHQPLHCADDHDHGGNDVAVTLLGEPTNLHAVWDSGLLAVAGHGERATARRVAAWLAAHAAEPLTAGTTVDWALEAHRAAVEHAYAIPRSHRLGQAYVAANLPVVDRQLALAAARLAGVLSADLR
jgi:hypothetical protein